VKLLNHFAGESTALPTVPYVLIPPPPHQNHQKRTANQSGQDNTAKGSAKRQRTGDKPIQTTNRAASLKQAKAANDLKAVGAVAGSEVPEVYGQKLRNHRKSPPKSPPNDGMKKKSQSKRHLPKYKTTPRKKSLVTELTTPDPGLPTAAKGAQLPLCAGGCGEPADKAHKCPTCKKNVHVSCGKPQGKKGHGQPVLCNACLEKETISLL